MQFFADCLQIRVRIINCIAFACSNKICLHHSIREFGSACLLFASLRRRPQFFLPRLSNETERRRALKQNQYFKMKIRRDEITKLYSTDALRFSEATFNSIFCSISCRQANNTVSHRNVSILSTTYDTRCSLFSIRFHCFRSSFSCITVISS